MARRLFFSFFLLIFFVELEAKPPTLTPSDTRAKTEEILRAHVCHQKLTPQVIGRTLQNFLEELDPEKSYFIENEILKWIDPSDSLLEEIISAYRREDFSPFAAIHSLMDKAVERRNRFEEELKKQPLLENVQISDFKDIKWATSETELKERLLKILSLRVQTASKISPQAPEEFIQRLAKRRQHRQEELLPVSPAERDQFILSCVLKAVSSALDSQTLYFTPAEANQFMIQVQQRLFGIGAQLRDTLDGLTIMRLVEGGPAHLAGALRVGDRIIAVNQEPIIGMDIGESVELIRGPQGTPVTLTVLREGEQKKEEKLQIEIIRGEVVLKESRFESAVEPYGDGVIGILHLFSFYQDGKTSSANDLRVAIEQIKKEHKLKGIILDLRNNAGGLLTQSVAVTSLFISKGVVVSIKDNTGFTEHLRNTDGKKIWDGPLLVLINRFSASASEIVAQTLQDYGRAIVVGDAESFGKGTFQTFTLEAANYGKVNPKGEYKVTRGRYYTVSGKSPQLVGVKSEIIIPGPFSKAEIGEQFSKFPVGTDTIAPHFEDDLSDLSAFQRFHLGQKYKTELQPVLTTYQPYLESLKKNSACRLAENKNYQSLLKELDKTDSDFSENIGQTDLQREEAINVMKDLILLHEAATQKAAA